jgi:cyclopropane fatty-acyl-phospholipid synthase-like methyltransferase
MKVFDFNGRKHKEASFHQKEWCKGIIADPKLKGNERILDIGCGETVS